MAGSSITACTNSSSGRVYREEKFPFFHGKDYQTSDGVAGLLYSQVGYEKGRPVRIVIRLPKKELLSQKALCKLIATGNEKNYESGLSYWGEIWKSHWWVAEFRDINESGEWEIEVNNNGEIVFYSRGLQVAENILWNKTILYSSVDMLERRRHFTKVGAGWQDAGTLWVESPAQSAMIIALTELLEVCADRFDMKFKERIYTQLIIGCNYLVMTQEKAHELGYPKGSMSHDLLGHEHDILPQDVVKAVIALFKTARILPDQYMERKKRYAQVADLGLDWLMNQAKPMGDFGMSLRQRALLPDTRIPKDEWMTRDLIAMCWAALEKWELEGNSSTEECINFARQVMERQIPENKPENGFWGHFFEFGSMEHSEKSWCHGIVDNKFGADIGGIYPNYLMPFIEMLQLWPEHEDAGKWKETLEKFAKGYLIPVCTSNPFMIIPLGIFGNEGPVWFAGPFHGTNTIYGYTAALALELSKLFNQPLLKEIAYGNLQWLAGLNAGITQENLKQAVIFSTDVPEGLALPSSMICNIGNRWAGTWFNTRGVICNGFSAGTQFRFDIDPTKQNDGPFSFTDEDWIPHSAGWLTALIRL